MPAIDPEQGERVRQGRRKLGLTQAEFAERIGLETAQAVSNIERGVTALTPDRARRIADVTRDPVAWYLDMGDDPVETMGLLRSIDDRLRSLEAQVASLAKESDVLAGLETVRAAIDRASKQRTRRAGT